MIGGKYLRAEIVRKNKMALISDPIFNKGTCYESFYNSLTHF